MYLPIFVFPILNSLRALGKTMKHQQVSVDFWAMGKALMMYGGLTVLGWIMMRLFNTVFTLPRRMRAQQDHIQNTLSELQRRFPDINITEDDLKNAEQELEAFLKEEGDKKDPLDITDEKEKTGTETTEEKEMEKTTDKDETMQVEDKKSI